MENHDCRLRFIFFSIPLHNIGHGKGAFVPSLRKIFKIFFGTYVHSENAVFAINQNADSWHFRSGVIIYGEFLCGSASQKFPMWLKRFDAPCFHKIHHLADVSVFIIRHKQPFELWNILFWYNQHTRTL